MVYWSQAWQDEFIINLLSFKKGGYFLDIGSTDGMNQSNSYFLESEMGWQGICVERGIGYTEHYNKNRKCIFLNEDALKVEYKDILKEFPKQIDYLSLDIDESSSKCLSKLPLNEYRFSVITIEHDRYRFQDQLRNEERECLRHYGYHLLFPDILVPLGCGMGPNLPFEDWWVDPNVFDMTKLNKFSKEKMYPDEVATLFRNNKELLLKDNK